MNSSIEKHTMHTNISPIASMYWAFLKCIKALVSIKHIFLVCILSNLYLSIMKWSNLFASLNYRNLSNYTKKYLRTQSIIWLESCLLRNPLDIYIMYAKKKKVSFLSAVIQADELTVQTDTAYLHITKYNLPINECFM